MNRALLLAGAEADIRRKELQAKHGTAEGETPLTGDSGPLLSPPAGTAPPRELEPQPTQQVNLFERKHSA